MTVINRTSAQFNLTDIVKQSRSLCEQLSEGLFQDNLPQNYPSTLPSVLNDEQLARWCQVVAKGDWAEFQKRLQWDGLDINTIRSRLSSPPLAEAQPLPGWALTLERIMQTASSWKFDNEDMPQSVRAVIEPQNPMPFEDLLLPALHVAHQQLMARSKAKLSRPEGLFSRMSSSAYQSLLRHLLCQIIKLCSQTLDFEFTEFRPIGYRILSLLGSTIELPSGDTQYRAFVQQLLQDGMLSFFQKYPVLGKLLATQIDFWVEATTEFLQRLEADYLVIQRVFSKQQSDLPLDLGEVIEIKPNLSDPHHQGRSVIALTFVSGLKLVYKPKNLSLEVAYNQLLEWCNQHFCPLPWRLLKVIDRQTHGWVEFIEHLPCTTEAEAKRFYQRSGMLLCLLYVLGANDCHYENLIASGEHPMLVDIETLMHPEAKQIQAAPEITIMRPIYQKFWDSVLRTGLLPRWKFNGRIAYDISGLGSVDPQSMPSQVPCWKSINRDDMHQGYQDITMPIEKNIAILDGVPLSPNHYLDQLIAGFEEFYRFGCQQRQALLASEALATLQGQPVRFLFRTTNVYTTILQNTLAPKFLQNGVERSIELNILARAFLISQTKSNIWPIFHSELRAMEQCDIPYFSTHSNSTALKIVQDMPVIEDYFEAASFNRVIDRLQKLSESDLCYQVKLIQETFTARVARSLDSFSEALPEISPKSPSKTFSRSKKSGDNTSLKLDNYLTYSPLTGEQLVSAASAISEKIENHAIQQADGSTYWIGLNYVPQAERFQLQPLEMSLYDGSCGIALFLAALDYIKNTDKFYSLILGALQNLRNILQLDLKSKTRLAQRMGIGGITGLGSIIYALVKINYFLGASPSKTSDTKTSHIKTRGKLKSTLLEDARLVAQLLTPEMIAADRQLDVMSGSAGAMLGLLTLYQATLDPTLLEKAILCGQHLIAHRTSTDGLPKAWKNFAERPLTGFSHGAAGIAYALLQLYAVTQDREYLAAAIEGIEYERRVKLPTAANWPDFRSPQEASKLMVSWCNGAAGIGLGRLGGLSLLATDIVYQDIEVALQTTQRYGFGVDRLCCGNFGRIELLVVAAQKLSRPELLESAKQQAAWIVDRANQAPEYVLAPSAKPIFSPGFFAGTAGIGYELLRLAFPEVFPSVLLLE